MCGPMVFTDVQSIAQQSAVCSRIARSSTVTKSAMVPIRFKGKVIFDGFHHPTIKLLCRKKKACVKVTDSYSNKFSQASL